MELNSSKRRGFMKAKLVIPFYRAAKQPSHVYSSSPSQSPYPSTTSTVSSKGYVMSSTMKNHAGVTVINPQPNKNKKVSFISTMPGDEAVDLKAANYISCVQERFRLQRINSERNISNMVPQDAQ